MGTAGALSWADGETNAKTISVTICDDDLLNEQNETVNLVLSNPAGSATLGPLITATLTIVNDVTPMLLTEENAECAR